jgi:hypothetical protein
MRRAVESGVDIETVADALDSIQKKLFKSFPQLRLAFCFMNALKVRLKSDNIDKTGVTLAQFQAELREWGLLDCVKA